MEVASELPKAGIEIILTIFKLCSSFEARVYVLSRIRTSVTNFYFKYTLLEHNMMKVAGKYIAKIFSDQDRFTYCGIMIVGLAILVILVSKASSHWEEQKIWYCRAWPYVVYMYIYLWHMLCLHLTLFPLCPCLFSCLKESITTQALRNVSKCELP